MLMTFPQRLSAVRSGEDDVRLAVRAKLACLLNLTERRPRGSAAWAQKEEMLADLSPFGDKP